MHILVMHRVPDPFARYADNLDHARHRVTYVSTPERAATLPADVPALRLERPGTGDTAAEVVAAVHDLPRPDLVVALSEYDLLPAARVREALGVPGPRVADVLPTRDKVVMKAAVAAAGLRTPRYAPLARALASGVEWTGRTVLKPLAGASSEGVTAYPTVREALDAVRGGAVAVDVDDHEVEEFVEGDVVHVDGVLADGRPLAVQASRYVGTCLGYAQGAPLGSLQVDTPPATVDFTLACLRAVGITEGPFHLEAIETADGPVFLEVGARVGGADVSDTFELATGVHMSSVHLRLLTGESHVPAAAPAAAPDARYGWFVVPGHTLGSRFCRVEGEKPFRDDPLVHRWVQRAPHEPVKTAVTYADADVPLAGVVGPAPSAVLERFLTDLFASVTVAPGEDPR
ncbi:ATP-grasp domain-containing protein [Streptomyces drozdowiczii]|uniref:ATP-grasp domain-containing protein n=1 Tax=Streptomyces drozdowiczii TaxID=202862 RepID=A0ABY6Q020_9ACTN|nr:ATP-grasp domain-containing protein [Streptomyces drozdowiczii]MCX0242535.1 ATP-grasp domain-containing protein [Streptomyces drozdowiczii]UZK57426.1 ATP-grasp domain-containing protein [Streptomyces drozdowiczii]